MITYAQIPAEGVSTSEVFKEPIYIPPRRPPEGATIHVAVATPDHVFGGFTVQFDQEKAKPGDWLEITLPDAEFVPRPVPDLHPDFVEVKPTIAPIPTVEVEEVVGAMRALQSTIEAGNFQDVRDRVIIWLYDQVVELKRQVSDLDRDLRG